MQPPVTRYACEHIGRQNGQQAKNRGFIRVAEIRDSKVNYPVDDHGRVIPGKKCPDCEKR